MKNEELIKRMQMCTNGNCEGCTYQYVGLTNTEECKEDLLYDVADALEAAEKRIADLETALAACRAWRGASER